jgi:copper homeostasis protein
MCQEVLQCKKMGVSGVAVGFLHRDLSVDIKKTKQMVDLAAPMQVTFHRAFDLCVQPQKALEDIIACGCRRLLTSGGKSVAFEGIESLQNIVKQANKRIRIIAAAGINSNNVAEIITRTQIDEVHASCKHVIAQINENHTDIHFDFSNVSFAETDAREVAAIMNQLSRLGSIHRN